MQRHAGARPQQLPARSWAPAAAASRATVTRQAACCAQAAAPRGRCRMPNGERQGLVRCQGGSAGSRGCASCTCSGGRAAGAPVEGGQDSNVVVGAGGGAHYARVVVHHLQELADHQRHSLHPAQGGEQGERTTEPGGARGRGPRQARGPCTRMPCNACLDALDLLLCPQQLVLQVLLLLLDVLLLQRERGVKSFTGASSSWVGAAQGPHAAVNPSLLRLVRPASAFGGRRVLLIKPPIARPPAARP